MGYWAHVKDSIGIAKAEMRLADFMLLAVLCALQYPLWFASGSWWNVVELHQKLENKQVILKQLKDRNDLLTAQVTSLQTGSHAVEELARRHLGMVSKGEVFVWVIPAKATPNSVNTTTQVS
ncbi:septum formation initiator family protein [Acidithiobacillus ferriphilus]|uniref:septum formation initiator family protein n=1 Tax=Acidithiobacillus ferriphilus TaxID=1689834 RepID=UPI00232BCCA8|nr:septum formation initiator family protein [Acidithiobacillus ferriphilus]WCE94940.1 septum formation initiator family protein [Acidithiobacillus ferriphilus]